MLHNQKEGRKVFVDPEVEKDITEDLLTRMEEDPQAMYDELATQLDAVVAKKARLLEINKRVGELTASLEEIKKKYGKDIIEESKELQQEEKAVSKEISNLLAEILPSFSTLEGNVYNATVNLSGTEKNLKLVLGAVKKTASNKPQYKLLAEHLLGLIKELDSTIDIEQLYEDLKNLYTKAEEDLGNQLQFKLGRFSRVRHAGVFDSVVSWLKSTWENIKSFFSDLFTTSEEIEIKTAEAEEISAQMVDLVKGLDATTPAVEVFSNVILAKDVRVILDGQYNTLTAGMEGVVVAREGKEYLVRFEHNSLPDVFLKKDDFNVYR